MSISENFEEVLLAFCKFKVEFMIAGGYAVNYHGYNRVTGDIDFWVKPVESNKEKIIQALKELGFPVDALMQVESLDFTKPFSFKIGNEPVDIDIFNSITGVQYSDAEKNMIEVQYSEKIKIFYIGLQELILNKMLASRTKDKLDVEELQKVQRLRDK